MHFPSIYLYTLNSFWFSNFKNKFSKSIIKTFTLNFFLRFSTSTPSWIKFYEFYELLRLISCLKPSIFFEVFPRSSNIFSRFSSLLSQKFFGGEDSWNARYGSYGEINVGFLYDFEPLASLGLYHKRFWYSNLWILNLLP